MFTSRCFRGFVTPITAFRDASELCQLCLSKARVFAFELQGVAQFTSSPLNWQGLLSLQYRIIAGRVVPVKRALWEGSLCLILVNVLEMLDSKTA